MKHILLIVLSLVLFTGESKDYSKFPILFPYTDTLPPPPPPSFIPLTGPTSACTGETVNYFAEVPVNCECEWRINGVLLPDTTPVINVSWTEPGLQIVSLLFVCAGGTSPPQAIPVTVTTPPDTDLGNDTTILQGQALTLDAGNPGCAYLWSTGAITRTIQVGTTGTYSVTVTNDCGTDWDDITVTVQVGIPEEEEVFDGKIICDGASIRIDPGEAEILHLLLTDASGRILYDGPFISSLNLEQGGLYFLRIRTKRGCAVKKLLVN